MKIIIEIEIEGDEQGAIDAVERALDSGGIQDEILAADSQESEWKITGISRGRA